MQDTKTDPYLKSKGCRISEIIWSLDKLSAACQTSWQVNHNKLNLVFAIIFLDLVRYEHDSNWMQVPGDGAGQRV